MQLSVKPKNQNEFPLKAILLKGTQPKTWIKELQALGFESLNHLTFYPLPGTVANSVGGCLVSLGEACPPQQPLKNEYCQLLYDTLFIPEYATLVPYMEEEELKSLFSRHRALLHPSYGLVALEEKIDWKTLIKLPQVLTQKSIKPAPSTFIPSRINSFRVHQIPKENVLEDFEKSIVSERKKFNNKKLNKLEKIKLSGLQKLFRKNKSTSKEEKPTYNPTSFLRSFSALFKKEKSWIPQMQEDLEALEERNKKEVDKLMDMLKKDPREALKYAIPLDEEGSSRGEEKQHFQLSKKWSSFTIAQSSIPTSGESGYVSLGDEYHKLRQQYNETAERLIKEGDYKEAAFVYMKLLRNFHTAGKTLEEGKHYKEAANIYLKHTQNKKAAAEAYEKGYYYQEAIDLYIDTESYEKAGDLYKKTNNKTKADTYYYKVIEKDKKNGKYIKASSLLRHKVENPPQAQATLLEGWKKEKESYECLNEYFDKIDNKEKLEYEINNIYNNELDTNNQEETFLKVIKKEYKKNNAFSPNIREMAYQLIAKKVKQKPSILQNLKDFNEHNDRELTKDISRYKR